jgi:hypothetical protein
MDGKASRLPAQVTGRLFVCGVTRPLPDFTLDGWESQPSTRTGN